MELEGNFTWCAKLGINYEDIEDAYNAVTITDGGYEFIKNNSPPEKSGFTWWNHSILENIVKNMKVEHTGCSYGLAMRNVESIIKNGWNQWVFDVKLAYEQNMQNVQNGQNGQNGQNVQTS